MFKLLAKFEERFPTLHFAAVIAFIWLVAGIFMHFAFLDLAQPIKALP